MAKICITHSCPTKNIEEAGKWDCNDKEYEFVKKFLSTVEYDDYEKINSINVILLGLPNGFTLLEKKTD